MKYECVGCGEELNETQIIRVTDEIGRCPHCDEEFSLNEAFLFEVEEEEEETI